MPKQFLNIMKNIYKVMKELKKRLNMPEMNKKYENGKTDTLKDFSITVFLLKSNL